MSHKALLLALTLGAVTLAGCSDSAPSGEFGLEQFGSTVAGSVTFTYTPPSNGYSPLPEQACGLDAITDNDPTGTLPTCEDAHTAVHLHVHDIPQPAGIGYTLYLVGTPGDENVGALEQNDEGMWELMREYPGADLNGLYDAAEIRMGEFVIATASTAAGENMFVIPPEYAETIDFTGSWEGDTIALTVSGLPDTAAYTGWLVLVDPDTGEKTHDATFGARNGAIEYQASQDIDHWQEVHIHVAGSAYNVGIATL